MNTTVKRTPVVINACCLLASALLMLSLPVAHAQDASVQRLEQRINRLERILDNSVLINMVQRFDALRDEVRQLRGELEQKEFELEAMRERQRKLFQDTDDRLQALEQGGGGLASLDDISLDEIELDEVELEADEPTEQIVLVPESTASQSSQATSQADRNQREKTAYQSAYDLLILGRNREAIEGFETFLDEFPSGAYTDNAHYWLGEANYVERRFDAAIDRFNVVIFQFPGSRKVPDARLRKGFALFELQRFSEARQELQIVERDYGGRSIAALARRRIDQMDRAGL